MEESHMVPQIPTGNAIFAIPKKGRLYEQCMKLINGAGLEHNRVSSADLFFCS
jgi:ATP phosphoribosyltransferase